MPSYRVAVALACLVAAFGSSPAPDMWLEVHFVDVGQGDGIWIRTPDDGITGNGKFQGKNIVIDGGPDRSDARNAMWRYMSRELPPETRIDAMLITHPHEDHYRGAWGLLAHYPVRDFYEPGYTSTSQNWNLFLKAVETTQFDGKTARIHSGRASFGKLNWGSEMRVEVLYAYPGSPTGLGHDNTVANNASIVLKLTYGRVSFLFMGDAEGKERDDPPTDPRFAEAVLLKHPGKLKSTVLKIAHHGSETSSTDAFIAAVDPDYVVVMSGRGGFSGRFLPDSSALRRYCQSRPTRRILRTDQDDEAEHRTEANDADEDNIFIRTDGTQIVVEAYSHGKRITIDRCIA